MLNIASSSSINLVLTTPPCALVAITIALETLLLNALNNGVYQASTEESAAVLPTLI